MADRKKGPAADQVLALANKLKTLNPEPSATCAMVYRIGDRRLDCDVISYDADGRANLLGSISVDDAADAKLIT